MPKQCSKCSKTMRSDRASDLCKACASFCHCGARKDFRATECIRCGHRTSALSQWSKDEQRKKKLNGLALSGLQRRVRYADLTLASFSMVKADGRRFARYWDKNEKLKYPYRYRWVWEQAHGPIPDGMQVHHINGDASDDRLSNLQLVTNSEHQAIHKAIGYKRTAK